MHKLVKYVFSVLGAVMLSYLLYCLVFGTTAGKGALQFACEHIEEPIARFYNTYSVEPIRDKYKETDEYDCFGFKN